MKTLHIQTQISEPELSSSVREYLNTLAGVEIMDGGTAAGLKGTKPEIVIIDEYSRNGAVFEVLANYRQEFPNSSVFLISDIKSTEHIVKTIKAGASEYFNLPVDFESLGKSIEEIRAASLSAAKGRYADIYSFISSKGGLGATVLAVNTASALADDNKKEVALCDLSLQSGDSAVFLDLVPTATIADLTRNLNRLDDSLIKNTLIRHSCGLDLLAAPGEGNDDSGTGEETEVVIKHVAGLYQKTVVDCPSTMVMRQTLKTLKRSTKVFIVLDLSIPAIRNAGRLANHLRQGGIQEEQLEFVVNRYTKNSAISVKEADRNLGKPVFWIFPNSYAEIFSSITNGSPLVYSQPRSVFAKSIRGFLKKLQDTEADKDYRGIKTLFKGIV
ncbi:MAG: hypothetical protein ACLFV2_07420 [Desulfurivibrionaceae bacterium]